MVQITGQVVIRRPAATVFDTLADPRPEQRYNNRILAAAKVTPGPVAVGSRFEQRVRAFGHTGPVAIEITGYQRPSRLGMTIRSAATSTSGDLRFEEVPEGTRATYHWNLQPVGVARALALLFALFGKRLEQGVWQNLKQYLEGETETTAQRLPSGE